MPPAITLRLRWINALLPTTRPRRTLLGLTTITAAALLASALSGGSGSGVGGLGGSAGARAQAAHAYGRLPLSFQPNQGQSDRRVRFLSQGAGYGLFLTRHRAVLALGQPGRTKHGKHSSQPSAVLSMGLIGARPDPQISGARQLPGHVNYLIGNERSRWHTAIPSFAAVRYSRLWPGIGMDFYGNQQRLEYDFNVSPGASVGQIGLRFAGQRRLRVDHSGDLALSLGTRTVHQLAPRAYQLIGHRRQPVSSHYLLEGHGRVAIRVGAYDHTRALIIDPQLVYSTYLGGNAYGSFPGDSGSGIAVDSAGNAFVTGNAFSTDFPTTPGAFQRTNHSHVDDGNQPSNAFITKLNRSGSGLVYSTYLGGHAYGYGEGDSGSGIAVDSTGNAYVTGTAFSTDFPTTPGAFQRTNHADGGNNAFITKLNPSGSGLAYSTYLGGSVGDYGNAIAVDSAGNAFVTGTTSSADFPTTPGAFQRTNHADSRSRGGYNAFITKLNPSAKAIAHLAMSGVRRRGDRLRLNGILDPAAKGSFKASARHGRVKERVRVRRHRGKFVATTAPFKESGSWKIAIRFRGRQHWASDYLCRKVHVGASSPKRWTKLGSKKC